MADKNKLHQEAKQSLDAYKAKMFETRKKIIEEETAALASLRQSKQVDTLHEYKDKAKREWDKIDQIINQEIAGYDQPNAVLMALISLMLHLAYALNAELTKLGLDPTHLMLGVLTGLIDSASIKSPELNATDIIKIDEPLDELVTCANGQLNFDKIDLSTTLRSEEKSLLKLMVQRELLKKGYEPKDDEFKGFQNKPSGLNISSGQLKNVLNDPSFLKDFAKEDIEFQQVKVPQLRPAGL